MEYLELTYLNNSVWQWCVALGITVGAWVMIRLLKGLIQRQIRALAAKTTTDLDDLVADLLKAVKPFVVLAIALYLGSRVLTLPAFALKVLTAILGAAVLMQVIVWGNHLIAFWAKRFEKRDDVNPMTVTVISILSRFVLFSLITLVVLDNLGFEITTLVAGLGVGGIAVALAVQNILGDLFSSLTIMFDKPFEIGDFIIVGDLMGNVEHVGLKTTRVRSLSGEQLVFSNSDLLSSRIRNFKRMYERRVVFKLGVTYQTPYNKLEAIPGIIQEIIEAQPSARFARSHFGAYGDFSLNIETVYYVLEPDYNIYMDIQQAINLAIYRRFENDGIEFAYPTQTLFMEKSA